jgi:hypothetical protein
MKKKSKAFHSFGIFFGLVTGHLEICPKNRFSQKATAV